MLRQFPATRFLPDADWPEGFLLVAALLVTGSAYARHISLQSTLMASCVIGFIGAVAHWISEASAIPFGPIHFPGSLDASPLQETFWVSAMMWVVLLLNARGMARLILTRRSKHRHHGLHLMGVSLLLILLMVMAMEPFASTVHHYWLWGETRLPFTWQGVPLSSLFAWCVVGSVASVAATPFLIAKRPHPLPLTGEPAWLWILISILFAVGTALAGLWPATGVAVLNGALGIWVALLAERRRRDGTAAW
jgi:hypothetical protein